MFAWKDIGGTCTILDEKIPTGFNFLNHHFHLLNPYKNFKCAKKGTNICQQNKLLAVSCKPYTDIEWNIWPC